VVLSAAVAANKLKKIVSEISRISDSSRIKNNR